MKVFCAILLTLTVNFCDGHLSLLGDLLSTAHGIVHGEVNKVATAVTNVLSHGTNLNVQGQFHLSGGGQGYNKPQNYRPQPPPPNQEQTVIVVYDETPPAGQQNHYNNFGHGNRYPKPNPGYNNPNWYPNGYGHSHNGHQYTHPNNQGVNYGHGQQYGGNQDYGNNYNTNQDRPNVGYGQNDFTNNNNNGYQNQNRPNVGYEQDSGVTNYNNNNEYEKPTENDQEIVVLTTDRNKYTTTTTTTPSTTTSTATEAPKKPDDLPLFVPLNPNEYIYGGDKIILKDPKRDTQNNKPADDSDEEFPIDVRFKDE